MFTTTRTKFLEGEEGEKERKGEKEGLRYVGGKVTLKRRETKRDERENIKTFPYIDEFKLKLTLSAFAYGLLSRREVS